MYILLTINTIFNQFIKGCLYLNCSWRNMFPSARVSCIPRRLRNHKVVKDGFELLILLLLPSKFKGYRCMPPCPTSAVLNIKPRALFISCTQPAEPAASLCPSYWFSASWNCSFQTQRYWSIQLWQPIFQFLFIVLPIFTSCRLIIYFRHRMSYLLGELTPLWLCISFLIINNGSCFKDGLSWNIFLLLLSVDLY